MALRATALISCAAAAALGQGPNDLSTLKAHLLQSYLISYNISGADADMAAWLPLILPNGTFSDLNYTYDPNGPFQPWTHALRMQEMGSVFMTPNCSYFQSPVLARAINATFSFWLWAQPTSKNWWFQAIGDATSVAQLTLQFGSHLTAAQAANASYLLSLSDWQSWSKTGANAIDIGKVRLTNGVITGNATMVAEAFAVIYSTFEYADSLPPNSPEGPKKDGSFMQHGPQLYNGDYGNSWANSALEIISLATNTSFNASGTLAYEIVSRVYLDGSQRMVHLPSLLWDVAVVGRRVASPGAQDATAGPGSRRRPDLLRAAGGYRAAEFDAFADAIDNPYSAPPRKPDMAIFHTSDYAVFSRPTFRASIRMIGARVAGGECINGAGTHSLHMADGATYLYKSGREYLDVGATWDWQRLPGTTVLVNGTELNCSTANAQGVLPNVGGVTDGYVGMAYMDFAQPAFGQTIAARKTAIYVDTALLFLGSAVSSAPQSRVTTTVESRLLASDGIVAAGLATHGPLIELSPGYHELPAPAPGAPLLLFHDNTGYIFPMDATGIGRQGASVSVTFGPVHGSWAPLNGDPNAPNVTNNMFTVVIDHGAPPVSGASYMYYVLPDISLASFESEGWTSATGNLTVFQRDAAAHVVYDSGSETGFLAVYDNSTLFPLPAPISEHVPSFGAGLPGGYMIRTYVNETTGNWTVSINVTTPLWDNDHVVSPGLAHSHDFYFHTGAKMIPCSMNHDQPDSCENVPHCLGFKEPCDPGWSYECLANGTIHTTSPPSQTLFYNGTVPPLICTLA